jgi:magnesium chelatase family protein
MASCRLELRPSYQIPSDLENPSNGVLFLDELPEFHRRLEVLRQPLEQGQVTIARALVSTTFPARFVLVATISTPVVR